MDTLERIKQAINSQPIVIFMKGTPQFPMCGFSGQAVQALASTGHPFGHVNVLENPDIRQELPKYADWPTFPQIYVNGELIGGCDILMEMYHSGELQTLADQAVEKAGA